MFITDSNIDTDFKEIPVSDFWSTWKEKELKMHKVHAYPAKFPAFVVSKSLEYAKGKNVEVNVIADIFCGCGTTALEAKINNLDFWGCDINPVATLIAKVKSESYQTVRLRKYLSAILFNAEQWDGSIPDEFKTHERINYWFSHEQIKKLYALLVSIQSSVGSGKYQDFFLCAFSNILKPSSRWLTKSIKPQVDPNKEPLCPFILYERQVCKMIDANDELNASCKQTQAKRNIVTGNFLTLKENEQSVDMLVTSPPYVTSYEYADLHQLSTLWIGYTDDYRTFRDGTIGSVYHKDIGPQHVDSLNTLGRNTYEEMYAVDKRKAKSVAKYFHDIQLALGKAHKMLKDDGLLVLVIGDTKYKGVEISNSKFITKCLLQMGFRDVDVNKRKIGSKILTPYRDSRGKFSSNSKHRKVYAHEYVIIAKK